jgi:large subunit ribosomal protein L4
MQPSAMNATIYNLAGREVGSLELPDKVFNETWRPALVRQAVAVQTANRRKPYAQAKMRGEVRGGGKKPWRQKGTGRARHGSIRSPIWKGGGVTHGPRADKQYDKKINKKMKRLAIYSALSRKLKDSELSVIDSFALSETKTKALHAALSGFFKSGTARLPSALIVPGPASRGIFRISANLPRVKSASPAALNVEDLLTHKFILIEKDAVAEIV